MSPSSDWVPGTLSVEDLHSAKIILQPPPSDDPNDPLNWSKPRKALNFTLACFYVLFTFVLLDIQPVIWGDMNTDLGISFQNLTNSFAANTAGLAIGAPLLLPLAHKYGRRPVYLFSLTVQLAGAIWFARAHKNWENLFINVFIGIAGAISEAIVQMTVADMFFVHQRSTVNAIYIIMVCIGTYLAPVAAGYSAASQGWRWIWWWCVIFIGTLIVVVFFFFEETKFSLTTAARRRSQSLSRDLTTDVIDELDSKEAHVISGMQRDSIDHTIPRKSYRERLALITPTDMPVARHLYQPFVMLVKFPAVTYCALMWGGNLAWFSVISTTSSTYLLLPPFNFGSAGIGLFSIAPFIGSLLAAVVGGPMTDWWILWRAKANRGVFEPEMRLQLATLTILLVPWGILMYGLGLAKGAPWIVLAVGYAIEGAAFTIIGDISLTYVIDCYQDIVGDALAGVAFVRNAVATGIVFAITPWTQGLGLYNMFVSVGCISVGLSLLTIPMMLFGKKARRLTANQYPNITLLASTPRTWYQKLSVLTMSGWFAVSWPITEM